MSITRFSIVTLILFALSIVCVIRPLYIPLRLPYLGRRRLPINLTTAPIIIIAILWASQCIGAAQIRDGIVGVDDVKPYNILILFFSLAYMAITLDITGLLQAAAFWVSNKGGTHGWRLYVYFYLLLTSVSAVVGNDPVVLSGTVFLVYYTNAIGLEPLPWLMAEFLAANTASMVLFVGNITNVVVCEGFSIINAAFTAYTILPFLGCSIFGFLAMAIQFRHPKHIPRKFTSVGTLDVRAALRDPVSALVGSMILGSCLVVIIVTSFFGVDVWKISLPFAGAKFIFDLAWDDYCYRNGKHHSGSLQLEKTEKDANAAGDYELGRNAVDDAVLSEIKRAISRTSVEAPAEIDQKSAVASGSSKLVNRMDTGRSGTAPPSLSHSSGATQAEKGELPPLFPNQRARLRKFHACLSRRFPTLFTALPRLPFALVPFSFSQFILIEALSHQGWIEVFAGWLVTASGRAMHPSIWLVGVLGVILCNVAGTNIGATILLTKVVRAAPDFPPESMRAAGIALAVATNIGAVGATFSASLAGLLWASILEQKGIHIKQRTFAFWNLIPLVVMTVVGLGIVSAEMAVLYH